MSRNVNGRVNQFVRELVARGALEPRQKEAVERALKRLQRAERLGNRREVTRAIEDIARAFLRVGLDGAVEDTDEDPDGRA
ncbi:MAG: hypothetical protein HY825_20405 [Acidobacteria bacterium]|nr:hypothetical protein [Acidobacteriota bacterium]